jgi:hypothetical protein
MFFQHPKYVSQSVNTDEYGQRYTKLDDGARLSMANIKDKCDLIIGSSATFGVGATDDRYTIASVLSNLKGRQVISLSGRAYNSRQELLLFIQHMLDFKKIENVIIISGANNLYVSSFHDKYSIPFFWSASFYNLADRIGLSRKKLALATFFDILGFREIDWVNVDRSNVIRQILNGKLNQSYSEKNLSIDISAAADRTSQDLLIFKKLSQSLGFNLVFCLQPVAGWFKKPFLEQELSLFEKTSKQTKELMKQFCSQSTYKEYKANITEVCRKNEISFHDLNSNIEISDEWFFVDRVHLTNLGYARVAEYIQDNIL